MLFLETNLAYYAWIEQKIMKCKVGLLALPFRRKFYHPCFATRGRTTRRSWTVGSFPASTPIGSQPSPFFISLKFHRKKFQPFFCISLRLWKITRSSNFLHWNVDVRRLTSSPLSSSMSLHKSFLSSCCALTLPAFSRKRRAHPMTKLMGKKFPSDNFSPRKKIATFHFLLPPHFSTVQRHEPNFRDSRSATPGFESRPNFKGFWDLGQLLY